MKAAIKILVAAFAFAVMASLPVHCIAQTANDAVRAFAKLEARIETGISYRDYSAALGDVNFELKQFADSAEANNKPELKAALNTTMLRHLEAKTLWGLTFGRYGLKTLTASSDLGREYLAKYPDAAKGLRDGGATFSGGGVSVEYLLPFLWRDAAESLRTARKMLAAE